MSSDTINALTLLCMSQTPFRDNFSIDEEALRTHLRRLRDPKESLARQSSPVAVG